MADGDYIIDYAFVRRAFDKNLVDELLNDLGSVNEQILDDAIASAQGMVVLALSRQYTLAQLTADAGIKRLIAVITMYMLETRRGQTTPAVGEAYAEAKQVLAQLQAGVSKLGAVDQVLPRISPSSVVNIFEESGYFDGHTELEA